MTFNWTLGAVGGDPMDADTFRVLSHCTENRTIQPRDPSTEAIAEFQSHVKLLRDAHERRLIDAWFAPPSRSPRHKGAIVFVVVNEILPRGRECMREYETRIAESAPAPLQ